MNQNQVQLDPQVVALSKAIMQTESNDDYEAKGKSGEWGAGQWTMPTWMKMSKAAGVNAAFGRATPEQQNQVIYTQLLQWKKQGYNIGQSASLWNTGSDANAYLTGNRGINRYGVQYDTKQYAMKVADAYHELNQPQQTNE